MAKYNTIIPILAMNHFCDHLLTKLPSSFKVYYPDDLPRVSSSIQGIITPFSVKITAEFIESLPNLKIISCFGTGIDNVDKIAVANSNICLTNTPDVVTEDTADIAIALLLCLSRNIIFNDQYARSGKWKTAPAPLATSVTGKTLGVVGLGKIGTSIAKRAISLGLKIAYTSKNKKHVPYVFYNNVTELAEISDFLIICCPGGKETQDLINLDVLKKLGQKGYLINISRGTTVNENDLIFSLKNKIIAGAGLDVYLNEPNIPTQLLDMNNVVLLPHIGTATQETREIMLNLVIDNIQSFFTNGKALTPVKF